MLFGLAVQAWHQKCWKSPAEKKVTAAAAEKVGEILMQLMFNES